MFIFMLLSQWEVSSFLCFLKDELQLAVEYGKVFLSLIQGVVITNRQFTSIYNIT